MKLHENILTLTITHTNYAYPNITKVPKSKHL